MAKYIDAEYVINGIRRRAEQVSLNQTAKFAIDSTIKLLEEIPAVDVVEVVRCKDCKSSSEPTLVSRYDLYCNNYDVRFCENDKKIVCGTHFCSYGERRDTE